MASYTVNQSDGINRIARNNHVVDDVFFISAFDNTYGKFVYVQQRGWGWTIILQLECKEDGLDCKFVSVYPIHPTIQADAIRSTWAYSAERRKYFVGLGKKRFMFYSNTELK